MVVGSIPPARSSAGIAAGAAETSSAGQQLLTELRNTKAVGRLVLDVKRLTAGAVGGPADVVETVDAPPVEALADDLFKRFQNDVVKGTGAQFVAAKLKDPAHGVIADRYDDASILFADIAGYTEAASEMAPTELVRFLDRVYTTFDRLVDRHNLEKIKTTGDSYMVVSGVPTPRPDHAAAIAALALDMSRAVADLRDPRGTAPDA